MASWPSSYRRLRALAGPGPDQRRRRIVLAAKLGIATSTLGRLTRPSAGPPGSVLLSRIDRDLAASAPARQPASTSSVFTLSEDERRELTRRLDTADGRIVEPLGMTRAPRAATCRHPEDIAGRCSRAGARLPCPRNAPAPGG